MGYSTCMTFCVVDRNDLPANLSWDAWEAINRVTKQAEANGTLYNCTSRYGWVVAGLEMFCDELGIYGLEFIGFDETASDDFDQDSDVDPE